jgi:hypothetical protein
VSLGATVALVFSSVVVALVGAAAPASALAPGTTVSWSNIAVASPPTARSGLAMAADAATQQVVAFGGQQADGLALGDTWIYDSSVNPPTWTQDQTGSRGLTPRYGASMAYDPKTDQLLMFGGTANEADGPLAAQTWIWTEISTAPPAYAWVLQTTDPASTPSARYNASLTYDAATQELVLFGGVGSTRATLNDTWAWTGTAWTEVQPDGSPGAPPARQEASMAFDQGSNAVILFGGCPEHQAHPCVTSTGSDVLGDTWSFGGTSWTQESPTTSPSPRYGAAMVDDQSAQIQAPVLFGGGQPVDGGPNGTVLSDTWVYDSTGTTPTWVQQNTVTTPPARTNAGLAYDTIAGNLVLFAGCGGGSCAGEASGDVPHTSSTSSNVLNDTWSAIATGVNPSTTTISVSPSTVTLGTPVTYTATVTGNAGVATGQVNMNIGGVLMCQVTLESGTGTCNSASAPVGNPDLVTGQYSGDPTYQPSTSPAVPLVVNPTSGTTPSTTVVSTDPGATTFGRLVVYSATVTATPPATGTPTGIVQFTVGSTPICTTPVLVNGSGSCTSGAAPVGSPDAVTGSYSGDATFSPSAGTTNLIVNPSDVGYWLVAGDGGIFSFGAAQFYGSMGDRHLNKPVVGIATTADGRGYYMVATDGGIFAFGDAHFYGSTGSMTLNKPIVGMAVPPDGKGYWLVAADGGIFSYGDAKFYGSMGGKHLNKPITGISTTPDGLGYWMDATDGGIFSFGDATFHGSTGNITLNKPMVGMASTQFGGGYWTDASDGGIFTFGDATFHGSMGGKHLNEPMVGMGAL